MEAQITKALRYYPDPATVNGRPVERYNFPNLARVTWESYPDRNTVSPHTGNLQVHSCTPAVVEGQRKCPRQLFGRSVTEAGWQQAGRVSEDGFWRDLWVV